MEKSITIKEIHKSERPYEKCEKFGAESLSNAELISVLLRSGTKGVSALELGHLLLVNEESTEDLLRIHHWNLQSLTQLKGVGKVKAIQVLCISELTRRLAKASACLGLDFHNPDTIAEYYMEDMRHAKQEHMKLLMLNTKARLIGETDVSKGTVNATLISPRELFIEALQKNAVSIVLLHNHPSGDPTPSKEDILITRRVSESGELLGIELLDHIIIGDNCYVSFAEQRLMP